MWFAALPRSVKRTKHWQHFFLRLQIHPKNSEWSLRFIGIWFVQYERFRFYSTHIQHIYNTHYSNRHKQWKIAQRKNAPKKRWNTTHNYYKRYVYSLFYHQTKQNKHTNIYFVHRPQNCFNYQYFGMRKMRHIFYVIFTPWNIM